MLDYFLAFQESFNRFPGGSKSFFDTYVTWFGEPGENAQTFFRLSALPE